MNLMFSQEERDRQQENIVANRALLWKLKQDPCADCKLRWHPACMTFDHIDRRTVTKNKNAKSINAILYYNPEMFRRALMNGSIICKNCHFIRELKRDLRGPMVPKHYIEETKELLGRCTGALLNTEEGDARSTKR